MWNACQRALTGFRYLPFFVILRTVNSKYFQHLGLLRSFLSLGLGFLNKGLAVSQSLGFTILYPFFCVWLKDGFCKILVERVIRLTEGCMRVLTGGLWKSPCWKIRKKQKPCVRVLTQGLCKTLTEALCKILKPRLTEHRRATKNGDLNNNNNIAEHRSKTKHTIDWYYAKCLTYWNYYQRLTLESWYANLKQTKPLPTSTCALQRMT